MSTMLPLLSIRQMIETVMVKVKMEPMIVADNTSIPELSYTKYKK